MQCPHCLIEIHPEKKEVYINNDAEYSWYAESVLCPNQNCKKIIIYIISKEYFSDIIVKKIQVYPKGAARQQAPLEVPKHIAEDYNEACLVFSDSLKASAALGRRCLQNLLRDTTGIKSGSLDSEIHQAMKIFPHYIADAIDAVRNIGNFALHPMKSNSTGEIVNVEPGEAEWLLDVLEELFDHCYVQPTKLAEKRAILDAKLADINKPPLKTKQLTK